MPRLKGSRATHAIEEHPFEIAERQRRADRQRRMMGRIAEDWISFTGRPIAPVAERVLRRWAQGYGPPYRT